MFDLIRLDLSSRHANVEVEAFKDLARGEQAATNMENQLTALESKIEDLLAQAEAQRKSHEGAVSTSSQTDMAQEQDRQKS